MKRGKGAREGTWLEGETGGKNEAKGWEERGPKAHSKNSDDFRNYSVAFQAPVTGPSILLAAPLAPLAGPPFPLERVLLIVQLSVSAPGFT